MSETVFVVDSPVRAFSYWEDPELGLAAELAALGQAGIGAEVDIECITHPDDLLDLAQSIATDENLPGRALVFAGVDPTSKLGRDHVASYSRLIADRLVRRAVPNVQFDPRGGEDEAFMARKGFFHYVRNGGNAVLQPSYSAFLEAVNRYAAATGTPYMAIVDALVQPTY